VPDDGAERVAVHVCPELPAGRVWVAGADELGLEALEFLLVAKLVGLLGEKLALRLEWSP
jgi:hypothetical protein